MFDFDVLKERRDQLSPAKQALLQKWILGDVDNSPASPIMARPQGEPIQLSFTQQRLWFLDQLQSNPTYNVPIAIQFCGALKPHLLEQSLNEVIKRHEILRTTFLAQNGQPIQTIAPALKLSLPIHDLTSFSAEEQEKAAQQIAISEARVHFDLAQGPLINATLLCLSETEHVMLLTQHHIISDRWSLGVMLQEIATLYQAQLNGQSSPLPLLPIQYADYAYWQRQWLSGQLLTDQLQYWKQRLHDAPTVLELPGDHARPALSSFRGAKQLITLPGSLTEMLRTWSQQENVTLFMSLLTAWSVLLFRYSGQEDILIGAPVANRARPELENLIGFFVNTLVLRTDLSGNPTVRQLLQRVRENALAAFAHQDLPFEQLVEELHLERDLSRTVLIQTALAWQNTPFPPLEFAGITLKPIEVDTGTAKFDLLLSLEDTAEGIQGMLEYNTDVFEDATISRFIGHYQKILAEMVAQPEQKIATLPLLTVSEREKLLVEWNATETAYPQDICIHQLFELQVQQAPEAIAIVFQEQRWTYQELNTWANKIAHHLKELEIGPGMLVAIYIERSAEMIPALLGILKAGAAYVPLEASSPPARLHWILDSLAITYLITQQDLLSQLANTEPLPALKHILCLDAPEVSQTKLANMPYQIWEAINLEHMSQENLPVSGKADELAYIIFTSGSTGTPKGVMVAHSPVINLINWVNSTFNVGPADRVLFITSLCFDLSVYDVFGMLAAGGSIHIASHQDVQEPASLLSLLAVEPITFWDSAPAALLQLTPFFSSFEREQTNETLNGSSSLRLVFLSGDWIPVSLPDQLKAQFPEVKVIGLGGATEATIWSNYYPIDEVDPRWSSIPYGKPIQNARYYILDNYLCPCPIGIPGHLYIGGPCLSMGYVNEAELTNEKFISSPFDSVAAARIYKTGDLARWRSDGNMEFLGRDDSQVKIRGFRIELGEIEAVLRQHPAVDHAIVQAYGETKNDKRLVAYIVPGQGQAPAITELRTFLQDYLPQYMQPSAFLLLDTLPVTSNGKLDRYKLPVPDFSTSQQANSFVAPRDAVELQLSLLWEEVLQVSPISTTASFFELGGHSLLAIQLMARVEQQFGQKFPLALLFQESTIERFANVLRQQKSEDSDSPAIGMHTSGQKSPLFFVHPGGGSVFCYVSLARHLGPDQPFYGLQTPGLNDDKEPYTDMRELATHYVQSIRVIQPEGPYHLGGWCIGGIIAYEMARQLRAAGQEVALLALLDSAPPVEGNDAIDNDASLFAQFAWDLGRLFGKNLPASYKVALLGLLGSALPVIGEQPVDRELVAAFVIDLLEEIVGPDASSTYTSLKKLTLDEQLHYLIAQVRAANINPPETEQAYLRHLYSIYSVNVRAIHQYVPEPYDGNLTIFLAQDEAIGSQQDIVAGWGKLSNESLKVYKVPGDHYTILKEPDVKYLASSLEMGVAVKGNNS